MECPNCKSEESLIDCIRSEIYCSKCGTILTASHRYVGSKQIKLPHGFRTGFRPCTTKTQTEYQADWNYTPTKIYDNYHYGEYTNEEEEIERKPYYKWEKIKFGGL